jgi:hypothetical protein
LPGLAQICFLDSKYIQEFPAARALHYCTPVTLKIERIPGKSFTTFTLIGRIQTEHLSELKAQLDAIHRSKVLDLDEVSLVNLDP